MRKRSEEGKIDITSLISTQETEHFGVTTEHFLGILMLPLTGV